MNIDIIASLISYKELFELQPKIYDAYNLFLKVKNKIKQKPFKVLIHKYNEESNNLLFFKEKDLQTDFITKNMSLKEINKMEYNFKNNVFKNFNKKQNISNNILSYEDYETTEDIFSSNQNIFFCGLKIYLQNIWNVYYSGKSNIIINVINQKNDEFLKLFVKTNDDIYSEKYNIQYYIKENFKIKMEKTNFFEYFFEYEFFCI